VLLLPFPIPLKVQQESTSGRHYYSTKLQPCSYFLFVFALLLAVAVLAIADAKHNRVITAKNKEYFL
jgi:hypothetical protein